MRRSRVFSAAAMSLLVLTAFGCGEKGKGTTPTETARTSASAGEPSPTTGSGTPTSEISASDFDSAAFAASTAIDNQWLPLKPGTQFVYEGHVSEQHARLRHRVVFTVTDLTKMIDGVRTVVIWDRDYTDGELVEGELAFFAQDDGGNVWLLGEYPEEYEDGSFVGAPDTWISGFAGAAAGIAMRSAPRQGTSSYLQGWAPEIEFADRARVFKTGQSTCVPLGCYENVLVIDEWNPDERGAHQFKYYATGLGNVRVGFGGREKQKETLVLADVVRLSPRSLGDARADALVLEERAYDASKDVYGHTPRAERLSATG
jgi:hypothetical protein